MAYEPLSDILASEIIDELSLHVDFAALSADAKLQILNSSQQEICDSYVKNTRADYSLNTLAEPTLLEPDAPQDPLDEIAYVPLSDILASQILTELGINTDFIGLSADEKLELLNSVQQEICDLYVKNTKTDYLASTMDAMFSPLEGSGIVSIVPNSLIFTDSSLSPKPKSVIELFDGIYQGATASVVVPAGINSLGAIKILFRRLSVGDLSLKFSFIRYRKDVAIASDSDASYNNYTGTGTDGQPQEISVPSTAFNGLSIVEAGDIITIAIEREIDSYNAILEILKISFEFA